MTNRLFEALAGMALLALPLLACGPADGLAPDGAGVAGAGTVQVRVYGLGEGDVDFVTVDLTPTVGSTGQAQNFDLERKSGSFSQVKDQIPAGKYTAIAEAFQTGNGVAVFGSDATNEFTVPAGGSVDVYIYLYQDQEGPDDMVPYFVSVSYDKEPMVADTVTFTVKAAGGNGTLELSGNSGGVGSMGVATGGLLDGTAQITWTIPSDQTPTNATVTLTVTDVPTGSTANLVMAMSVDAQSGNVLFDVGFNHAPEMVLDLEALNQENSTKVTLTFTFSDPEGDDVAFTLDFSDCERTGVEFSITPGTSSGILDNSNFTGAVKVELSAADGDPRTCTVEVELEDDHAAAPATSSHSVEIRTGWTVSP